jgi:molybdenum cofactor cytidylyltransferase
VNASYAAIVLAGGLSTRMGRFKPLLPLGEGTITDHIIATFLSAGVDVILVVGHRCEEIVSGIKSRDITVVYNRHYKSGMFSSVRAGLRRLTPAYKACFVLPVDIPLVQIATIKLLMEAEAENPGRIIYPVFKGKRGHPPLISFKLIPAILGWKRGGGLKAVLYAHRALALEVPVSDAGVLFDIDTPEDYDRLKQSL